MIVSNIKILNFHLIKHRKNINNRSDSIPSSDPFYTYRLMELRYISSLYSFYFLFRSTPICTLHNGLLWPCTKFFLSFLSLQSHLHRGNARTSHPFLYLGVHKTAGFNFRLFFYGYL